MKKQSKFRFQEAFVKWSQVGSDFIVGSVQLAFWIFFRPTAWRRHLNQIDNKLNPHFCLIELSQAQWANKALILLILKTMLVWPILFFLVSTLALSVSGLGRPFDELVRYAANGFVYWTIFGLIVALFISLANTVITTLALGLLAASQSILNNLVWKTDYSYAGLAQALGLTLALGFLAATANMISTDWRSPSSSRQKVRAVLLVGLAVAVAWGASVLLAGVAVSSSRMLGSSSIPRSIGVFVGILICIAVVLRTKKWKRGLLVGVIMGAAFVMITDSAYSRLASIAASASDINPSESFVLFDITVFVTTFCAVFFTFFSVVGERLAGPLLGTATGAAGFVSGLGAMHIYLEISGRANASLIPVWPILAIVLLMALSFGFWRSVALFPLQMILNLLLYLADKKGIWSLRSQFYSLLRQPKLPELRSSLLLTSLQLPFWLIFEPGIWRHYVRRTVAYLRPDFYLTDFAMRTWKAATVKYLVVNAVVVWPLVTACSVAFLLWLVGIETDGVWIGASDAVIRSEAVFFGLAMTTSLAAGLIGGVSQGFLGGLAHGVDYVEAGSFSWGALLALMSGMAVGVLGAVCSGLKPSSRAKLCPREWTAIALGLIAGGLVTALLVLVIVGIHILAVELFALNIEEWVLFYILIALAGLICWLALGIIAGLQNRHWRRGLHVALLGLGGLGLGLFLWIVVHVIVLMAHLTLFPKNLFGSSGLMIPGQLTGLFMGSGFCVLFAASYAIANSIGGNRAGSIAGTLVAGGGWIANSWISNDSGRLELLILGIGSMLVGFTVRLWAPPLLRPLGRIRKYLLNRYDNRPPNPLRWNAAFWDENQMLPLLGLKRHLLLVASRAPTEAFAAMDRLAKGRQRWASKAAKAELDIRLMEACMEPEAIAGASGGLVAHKIEGALGEGLKLLAEVSSSVRDALGLVDLQYQRQALIDSGGPLDDLERQLARARGRRCKRLRNVARNWGMQLSARTAALALEIEKSRREIKNPYIVGLPLSEGQPVFVGRFEISIRIERFAKDDRGLPMLLQGPHRIGKTSLLKNLHRRLPISIIPLFVDLQGAVALASDHVSFLDNLAQGMARWAKQQRRITFPSLSREALAPDPFTRFNHWLDEVEDALQGTQALLELDEFEALENAFATGRLDPSGVLPLMRHMIEHRPRIRLMLAGSHALAEMPQWAEYVQCLKTIDIGFLKEEEALGLIQRPFKDFPLRYESDACRQLLQLTHGHPCLVQLACAEIVSLKNEQKYLHRRLVRAADIDEAVPRILERGSFFFADTVRDRSDAEMKALKYAARQGEGAVVDRMQILRHVDGLSKSELDLDRLVQRGPLEKAEGGFRFQIELVRRWILTSEELT